MLVVGDYIRKRSFNTFGTETDSKPVIKISSLSTILGSKGGFSRWLINGVYQMLPSDFIIISEDEAIRIMGIWEDSAEISPVANVTLNTKCIREDNGKPKVTYHGKAGWRKPLFNFRMKNPNGGFQAYKCPECGKIHIGKTMEIPGEVKHISQTLLEFTNDQLMDSVGDYMKWQKEGNEKGYPWERFKGATCILYENYIKPLESEGFSAWLASYNLICRELARRQFIQSINKI
jgi:hypothetical protein